MSAVLTRHHDVLAALHAPEQFSNKVSSHLNVPNGMDGAEHLAYRALIEPFFSDVVLTQFQPKLQVVIDELLVNLDAYDDVEVMATLGHPFALRVQCAFMGWPVALEQRLTEWIDAQNAATLAQDRPTLRRLADEFSDIVIEQFDRALRGEGDPDSITAQLTRLRLNGTPVSDDYLVSIVRNWTVGELGTIAAAIGSIVGFLAQNPVVQKQLREAPMHIDHAINEILRLDAPLLTNRRRTTCPVNFGDMSYEADTTVTIDWRAANNDPKVFVEPQQFKWDRDPHLNLLYGAGVHVCPGKPLAQLELGLFTRSLLNKFETIQLGGQPFERAQPPRGGYRRIWVKFNH
ncbi:cytochrome P450 [Pseudidiomarina marina]|uniref:cytochrome P450 n=1 Tax=Pseudidiomarina marina TaxID=502366 RepID=UPI00384E259F